MVDDAEQSILGAIGSFIAPVFAPLGFGTWQAAVALLTGLVAKEAVVSSMSLLYGFSITGRRLHHRRGPGRHLPHPGGRLRLPGVYPAVRPLRGRRVHPVPGDEQPEVDAALHPVAAVRRLAGVLRGVPGGQPAVLR